MSYEEQRDVPELPEVIYPCSTQSPYLGALGQAMYNIFFSMAGIPDSSIGVSGMFYEKNNECWMYFHAGEDNKLYLDFYDGIVSEDTFINTQIVDFNIVEDGKYGTLLVDASSQ
ncbi:hypothetical protein V757_03240 [Pelistega indica]|uniref:Uncharacterized protein n=2 Tax=Pelistega indica TaxID=1414851 RepID=V8GA91_9BURK|nr:hypothetical protein V757_03240 [Pelistega indica]